MVILFLKVEIRLRNSSRRGQDLKDRINNASPDLIFPKFVRKSRKCSFLFPETDPQWIQF